MKKIIALLLLSSLVLSCVKEDEGPQTMFMGSQLNIGNGKVWTFVELDATSLEPTKMGVQFDATALENLPPPHNDGHTHGNEYLMDLPEVPDVDLSLYKNISFDWQAVGHFPPGTYDISHFDIHFYMISVAERALIVPPLDSDKFMAPMNPEHLPETYIEIPGGEVGQGNHMISSSFPEINGTGIFTHTFIYGKYEAQINFLEPMVTLDYLLSKTNITTPIGQPQEWQQAGYYPNEYTIHYDEATAIYTISLDQLTWSN